MLHSSTTPAATGWHVTERPGRYPQVEDAEGRLVALVVGHAIWAPSATRAHAAQIAASATLVRLLDGLMYAVQEQKYGEARSTADEAAWARLADARVAVAVAGRMDAAPNRKPRTVSEHRGGGRVD